MKQFPNLNNKNEKDVVPHKYNTDSKLNNIIMQLK